MLTKVNFYFFSTFSFIFNIFFLITCNKFGDVFLEYLKILIYINFFICCFGSLQFYIKAKKNNIVFNIEKKLVIILITFFFIGFIYYLTIDLKYSLVYLTTCISSLIIHLKICSQTFLNKLHSNAFYLFIIGLIKFVIIFFSFLKNIDFIVSIIFMNSLIIVSSLKFLFNIKINLNNKNLFNLSSCINNLFGTTTTTLDKIYVVHILPNLSATYYLVFKIASIYQFFTELIYRKERFEITSGKYTENNKVILIKFICLFTIIIFTNFIVKISINFFENTINLILINDLFEILNNHIDSISIFFLGFLINAVSGLNYDQIYKYYFYKKVMSINIAISIFFIALLIFYGKNIIYISIIFLLSQLVELALIYIRKKNLNVN